MPSMTLCPLDISRSPIDCLCMQVLSYECCRNAVVAPRCRRREEAVCRSGLPEVTQQIAPPNAGSLQKECFWGDHLAIFLAKSVGELTRSPPEARSSLLVLHRGLERAQVGEPA